MGQLRPPHHRQRADLFDRRRAARRAARHRGDAHRGPPLHDDRAQPRRAPGRGGAVRSLRRVRSVEPGDVPLRPARDQSALRHDRPARPTPPCWRACASTWRIAAAGSKCCCPTRRWSRCAKSCCKASSARNSAAIRSGRRISPASCGTPRCRSRPFSTPSRCRCATCWTGRRHAHLARTRRSTPTYVSSAAICRCSSARWAARPATSPSQIERRSREIEESMMLSFVGDAIVAVLLIATIGYAAVLNRAPRRAAQRPRQVRRADRNLTAAAQRAEAGVAGSGAHGRGCRPPAREEDRGGARAARRSHLHDRARRQHRRPARQSDSRRPRRAETRSPFRVETRRQAATARRAYRRARVRPPPPKLRARRDPACRRAAASRRHDPPSCAPKPAPSRFVSNRALPCPPA